MNIMTVTLADGDRTIDLHDDIDDESMTRVIRALRAMSCESTDGITIYVTSSGGSTVVTL